jgi:hypothetical protein
MANDNSMNIFDLWTEPESAANTNVNLETGEPYVPQYPYNHVTHTESGHSFEMDDTPTRERIRLQHRSNTFIEMHPNGTMVQKIWGNGYEIIANDKNVLIKGACNVTIYGDAHLLVKGDKIEKIEGNYELHVQGDYSVTTEGDIDLYTAADFTVGVAPTGLLNLNNGDSISFGSDLHIEGELTAAKITSTGSISAEGVIGSTLGFASALGGLSIGPEYLIPVPGQVLIGGDLIVSPGEGAGAITSTAMFTAAIVAGVGTFAELNAGVGVIGELNSLKATIGDLSCANEVVGNLSGGVSSFVTMQDATNSAIFDTHIHFSLKGPTGPPDIPFV